jgi:hypothetical protein
MALKPGAGDIQGGELFPTLMVLVGEICKIALAIRSCLAQQAVNSQ